MISMNTYSFGFPLCPLAGQCCQGVLLYPPVLVEGQFFSSSVATHTEFLYSDSQVFSLLYPHTTSEALVGMPVQKHLLLL